MSNFIDQYKDVILDELNVKSIERLTNAGDLVNYKIKPNLPVLGRKYQSGLKDIIGFLNTQNNDELFNEYESTGKIRVEKNNNEFNLIQEDIIIETLPAEGFSAVSGNGITVGLSLELSDDLIQEGIVRDLVRQVQNVRKDAGFSVEDRINIYWELDGEFQEAVSKFEKYFCNETLTTFISNITDVEGYKAEFQIKEKLIKIVVKVVDK
jgi:isoleucyl-tRNA synthetase